jgi:hypothetical protein
VNVFQNAIEDSFKQSIKIVEAVNNISTRLEMCDNQPHTKGGEEARKDQARKLINLVLKEGKKIRECGYKLEDSIRILRVMFVGQYVLPESRELLSRKCLEYYVLASYAFRICGAHADGLLSLWSLTYVLGIGTTYNKKNISAEYEKSEDAPHTPLMHNKGLFSGNKLGNIEWLFGESNVRFTGTLELPIQQLSQEAFGYAYQAHREFLKSSRRVTPYPKTNKSTEFDKADKILYWIQGPLSQSATALNLFWNAFWFVDKDIKMNESAFQIRDMGAFPVQARILAQYLKARWYIVHANYLESIDGDDTERETDRIKAFLLLIKAIDDGNSYQAGGEMLSPPFAFLHYHLWEALDGISEGKRKELRKSKEFQGHALAFLDINYLNTRAKVELETMINRHHGGDAFFRYARNSFYLHDDFADNYNTVAWIVEYGLLPVAKEMLRQLDKSRGSPEA